MCDAVQCAMQFGDRRWGRLLLVSVFVAASLLLDSPGTRVILPSPYPSALCTLSACKYHISANLSTAAASARLV